MIQKEDIKKLATLARIEMNDVEVEGMQKDVDAILSYVDQIKTAPIGNVTPHPIKINVFREDVHPHESGIHKDELLHASIDHDKDYIKVKKII